MIRRSKSLFGPICTLCGGPEKNDLLRLCHFHDSSDDSIQEFVINHRSRAPFIVHHAIVWQDARQDSRCLARGRKEAHHSQPPVAGFSRVKGLIERRRWMMPGSVAITASTSASVL